ncbi:hypothetical protein O0L34_g18180 [Tuta absoluta]|nr:hypothetical protein O0L34_g18180 [Tuta absoluta]
MPPKSIKDHEDNIIKRRLAQKLLKKRRYAEIKNDPELLELEKKKRRDRYLKQKEANKENKKSARALKEQRKKWKENSKRYRQRKREEAVEGEKKPPFQVVNIQVVANAENSSETSDTEMQDPLYNRLQIKEAVRKVRYVELKKGSNCSESSQPKKKRT